jgi:hypothetical protein
MLEEPPMLPPEYFPEYKGLLASLSRARPSELFGKNAESNWRTVKHAPFWPATGSLYKQNEDLLLVGRATNGADYGLTFSALSELSDKDDLDRYLSLVARGDETLDAWMARCWRKSDGNKYSLSRSVFWKAAKAVVGELTEGKDFWASRLAWTNLYKLAPAKAGNPSDRLCKHQLEHCVNLLKLELEAFKPRYVLFVTGEWYLPFMGSFGLTGMGLAPQNKNNVILRTENRDGQKWIFTARPDRRPAIEPRTFAKHVFEAFKGQ